MGSMELEAFLRRLSVDLHELDQEQVAAQLIAHPALNLARRTRVAMLRQGLLLPWRPAMELVAHRIAVAIVRDEAIRDGNAEGWLEGLVIRAADELRFAWPQLIPAGVLKPHLERLSRCLGIRDEAGLDALSFLCGCRPEDVAALMAWLPATYHELGEDAPVRDERSSMRAQELVREIVRTCCTPQNP